MAYRNTTSERETLIYNFHLSSGNREVNIFSTARAVFLITLIVMVLELGTQIFRTADRCFGGPRRHPKERDNVRVKEQTCATSLLGSGFSLMGWLRAERQLNFHNCESGTLAGHY